MKLKEKIYNRIETGLKESDQPDTLEFTIEFSLIQNIKIPKDTVSQIGGMEIQREHKDRAAESIINMLLKDTKEELYKISCDVEHLTKWPHEYSRLKSVHRSIEKLMEYLS